MAQDATGMQVGFGTGHIVLEGPSSPSPKKEAQPHPQFSAHIYCALTAGWIKMPLAVQAELYTSDTVLHGNPAPPPKRGTAPNVWPMSIVAKQSPISTTAKHLLTKLHKLAPFYG